MCVYTLYYKGVCVCVHCIVKVSENECVYTLYYKDDSVCVCTLYYKGE